MVWEFGWLPTGRAAERYLQDNKKRCPASMVEYLERLPPAMRQQQQRTNRSTFSMLFSTEKEVKAETYEDKHSIGVSFPTFRSLLVLFLTQPARDT